MLGLPDRISALLFDLDGVLTDTASVHFAAWRETFDRVLPARDDAEFTPNAEFTQDDYDEYVDGKPREAGVRSFLESRHLTLPDGATDDRTPDTVNGIANLKNDAVLALIEANGVRVYPGSLRYLESAAAAGLRRAVVSSSANAGAVLHVTGLERFVEERVDGATLATEHLAGKPAPDSFLAGARRLGVDPAHAAVFEDAVAGVAAGRAGGFGFVVGVNRLGEAHAAELRSHGADVVVGDLGALL
jgi:beta-phosphoglucomutase family hydrolase